ncbi:hypothetical protein LNQ81_17775 [Myroides sp. M-43]|uniref:hypothetical protein n=1 Tax=Myroides oncorhynchi TaxID=2893756 RepID=UPI001E564760|nr:hypothetical protein [Myroides oncorhynchi]MCC9044521.1 hypothetical protein [Myroides oncorhynchi]
MKKNIITLLVLTLSVGAFAQKPGVGIGVKKVNPAAALEIQADKKGVLIPRLAIGDLKTFGLEGTAVEGVLVYNNTPKAAATGVDEIKVGFHYWSEVSKKWELITSQTQLDTAITNVTNEFNTKITDINTKIDNIIDGGTKPGDTDKSFMVVFKPETGPGSNPAKGELQYLIPTKDAATGLVTYTKQVISFGELVQGAETETFIMATDAAGVYTADPKLVKLYVYFGEKAVRDWVAADANKGKDPKTNMSLADGGIKVDVVGAVSNDFSKLINDNSTTLQEFISKTDGGLTLDAVNKKFIINKDGAKEEVLFNTLETVTKVQVWKNVDGTAPVAAVDADVKGAVTDKGTIVYEYISELTGAKNYINLTADVITSVTNNENLKKELFKVVNNYNTNGGNVYFGYMSTGTPGVDEKQVLYTMDENKVKKEIDISQDIITNITNNPEVIKTINNLIKVDVLTASDASTKQFINGKEIYKAVRSLKISGAYDSEFKATETSTATVVSINPYNLDKDGKLEAKNSLKLDKVLKVTVLNASGVVADSVTEVVKNGDRGFTFALGNGNVYTPILGGDYEVVFEYTAQ